MSVRWWCSHEARAPVLKGLGLFLVFAFFAFFAYFKWKTSRSSFVVTAVVVVVCTVFSLAPCRKPKNDVRCVAWSHHALRGGGSETRASERRRHVQRLCRFGGILKVWSGGTDASRYAFQRSLPRTRQHTILTQNPLKNNLQQNTKHKQHDRNGVRKSHRLKKANPVCEESEKGHERTTAG